MKIDYLRQRTVPASTASNPRRIVIAPPDIHSNNIDISNGNVDSRSSNSIHYDNDDYDNDSNAEEDGSLQQMEQFEQIDEDDQMNISPRRNYATPLNWLGVKPNRYIAKYRTKNKKYFN